jgi:hypothetical protein
VPPEWAINPESLTHRPPCPPGIPAPIFSPPVHTSELWQITFASAGLAALILIVVTAAIIAAVVIAITKSLVFVFRMMHPYFNEVFKFRLFQYLESTLQ